MKITIVIPLHNEEKHITKLLKDLAIYKMPIVVVDDGSTDTTSLKLRGVSNSRIKVLTHGINLGKGASMKTGAEFAFSKGADAIIFMDGDGQHAVGDLPKFLDKLNEKKYDIVYGSRVSGFGVPLVRFLGNKFASIVMGLFFGIYISDSICGFRAITKHAYKKIKWESDGYGVEIEMIARTAKNKLKFVEIPVETIYHDHVKGVTLMDAFSVLISVVKWRLTI